jgi:hypothetical protein
MEKLNLEKTQRSSIIQSLFLPDSALQGSEFPIHLIWDKERFVNIDINIPFSLVKLKEVYNVDETALKIEKDLVRITNFESNGYVGFVFSSGIYKEAFVEVPIRIEVRDNVGEKQIIERKIIFFRPHVVLYEIPINIELIQKGDQILVDEKICFKNEGKGAALVNFEISKESDATIKKPEEIEEFIERFCSRFSGKLNGVKKAYPQYLEIINGFETFIVDSIKGTFTISEQYIKKMQDIFDRLERAFEENEAFLRDVLDSILSAYLSAVNILTEVRSFLEYLKSLAENKVILLNAISMIEFKPGLNLLKGRLLVQDLAGNIYEPIEIQTNVKVKSDNPIMIPLYEIFKWMV